MSTPLDCFSSAFSRLFRVGKTPGPEDPPLVALDDPGAGALGWGEGVVPLPLSVVVWLSVSDGVDVVDVVTVSSVVVGVVSVGVVSVGVVSVGVVSVSPGPQ